MANATKPKYDFIDDSGGVRPPDDDPSGQQAWGAGEVLDSRYIPSLDIRGDHEGYASGNQETPVNDAVETFQLPNFVDRRKNNGDGYSDSELDPHYGKGGETPRLSAEQAKLNLSEIDRIRAEIAKLPDNEK